MHYFVDGYAHEPRSGAARRHHASCGSCPSPTPTATTSPSRPGNRLWRKNLRDNNGDGAIEPASTASTRTATSRPSGATTTRAPHRTLGSETYRGTAPGSEPETRALDGLMRARRLRVPDQLPLGRRAAALPVRQGGRPDAADDPIFEALSGTDGRPASSTTGRSRATTPTSRRRALHHQRRDDGPRVRPLRHARLDARARLHASDLRRRTGVSDFEFPDDEAEVQAVFEKNIPFALDVAASAATAGRGTRASRAGEYQATAPDFEVDRFAESYGNPQLVQANVRRDLGPVVLRYKINGGHTRTSYAREFRGGERYGEVRGVFYHKVRGTVRGADDGDTVRCGSQAGRKKSEPFTYTVADDGHGKVLLLAAEDYTGNSPGTPYAGPLYLDAPRRPRCARPASSPSSTTSTRRVASHRTRSACSRTSRPSCGTPATT